MAFAAAGHQVTADGGRPVIGIANSASELNPCNLPLRALAGPVRDGIQQAGGIPVEFGSISLGEDLMKPSAMLYRNLLAIEIEEIIRSNPLDGIVLLAGCDKTVPGAIMGAASADLPMVVVTSGARAPATFRGRRIGSGSDLWRLWDERRAGCWTTRAGASWNAAWAARPAPATRWAPRPPWPSWPRRWG